MRWTLKKMDYFTALTRLLDDCWAAMPLADREAGLERIKNALGTFEAAPSDDAWQDLTDAVAREVGRDKAEVFLGDFKPYVTEGEDD